MSHIYELWVAWGVLVTVLLILLGYRGQITRYEEDQIFLGDATNTEVREQTDVQRKLQVIRPYLLVTGWVIGLLTVVILGLYIHDAVLHLM